MEQGSEGSLSRWRSLPWDVLSPSRCVQDREPSLGGFWGEDTVQEKGRRQVDAEKRQGIFGKQNKSLTHLYIFFLIQNTGIQCVLET